MRVRLPISVTDRSQITDLPVDTQIASSENGLFIAEMEFSVRTGLTSRRSTNSRAIDRHHHKDRPDGWDMVLLLGRPNYAALDQEAKVAVGCGKHFGSPDAAPAKKRAEFREALAARL
jgi:hypothetical protein